MKKYLWLTIILGLSISCSKKNATEREIEIIPIDITLDRFDKDYFETPLSDLGKLKAKYPYMFPDHIPDSVWAAQKQDPIFIELNQEVLKKFPNTDNLKEELTSFFRHVKYYFPDERIPKVNTIVSEVDYNFKTFYSDSLALISLDLYLGKNHRFYETDAYLRETLEPRQILPDIAQSFAYQKVPFSEHSDFLSLMIYEGKILYLKDLLLPDFTDAEKIGYTQDQLDWAVANEENVWRYFIDQKMLYSSDASLASRFIRIAPFSKFYLDIDNQSPGRIGCWIGWQIVRSYAQNNNVTLEELLFKKPEELFKQSKYKPLRS